MHCFMRKTVCIRQARVLNKLDVRKESHCTSWSSLSSSSHLNHTTRFQNVEWVFQTQLFFFRFVTVVLPEWARLIRLRKLFWYYLHHTALLLLWHFQRRVVLLLQSKVLEGVAASSPEILARILPESTNRNFILFLLFSIVRESVTIER